MSGGREGVTAPELEPGTVTVSGWGEGTDETDPEPAEPGAPGAPEPYGDICGPADGPEGADELDVVHGPDGAPWDPTPDIVMVSVPVKPE